MKTLANDLDQQEILNRIAELSKSENAKWGRMSVHEMICHLNDSYCVPLGEKRVSPDTGVLQRTVFKWIALWAPIQWMKGYPTRPEIEQGRGGTPPNEFEADRAALRLVFMRFCKALPQTSFSHPVFGPMGAHEWGRWGYLHADHHLRQFGH